MSIARTIAALLDSRDNDELPPRAALDDPPRMRLVTPHCLFGHQGRRF